MYIFNSKIKQSLDQFLNILLTFLVIVISTKLVSRVGYEKYDYDCVGQWNSLIYTPVTSCTSISRCFIKFSHFHSNSSTITTPSHVSSNSERSNEVTRLTFVCAFNLDSGRGTVLITRDYGTQNDKCNHGILLKRARQCRLSWLQSSSPLSHPSKIRCVHREIGVKSGLLIFRKSIFFMGIKWVTGDLLIGVPLLVQRNSFGDRRVWSSYDFPLRIWNVLYESGLKSFRPNKDTKHFFRKFLLFFNIISL